MKLKRNGSIIFIIIYGMITLGGRFYLESVLHIGVINSVMIGVFFLTFLLILFKLKFLTLKEEEEWADND